MTTTTHPAGPGFTAAFITGDFGEPLTYQRYSAEVNPAGLFSGSENTSDPYPADIPALDAQLARDAYLRVGDWSWTADIWGCAVRQITIPAGIQIRRRDTHKLTVQQAITIIASGNSALTVTGLGEDGKTGPDFKASLLPVNIAFGHGARVALAGGTAYSPQVSRTRIAIYALAADIAEAANLIAARVTAATGLEAVR